VLVSAQDVVDDAGSNGSRPLHLSDTTGQTPDETCFVPATNLPTELAAAWDLARAARLAANCGLSCDRCLGEQVSLSESEILP
jgi:hypothetical protein